MTTTLIAAVAALATLRVGHLTLDGLKLHWDASDRRRPGSLVAANQLRVARTGPLREAILLSELAVYGMLASCVPSLLWKCITVCLWIAAHHIAWRAQSEGRPAAMEFIAWLYPTLHLVSWVADVPALLALLARI